MSTELDGLGAHNRSAMQSVSLGRTTTVPFARWSGLSGGESSGNAQKDLITRQPHHKAALAEAHPAEGVPAEAAGSVRKANRSLADAVETDVDRVIRLLRRAAKAVGAAGSEAANARGVDRVQAAVAVAATRRQSRMFPCPAE